MKQEQIDYNEIIKLGFNVDVQDDKVYFNRYGYDYCIITKDLTKKIYIDWEKETRLCTLTRINSPKNGSIEAEFPVQNLQHLKEIINFFTKNKK